MRDEQAQSVEMFRQVLDDHTAEARGVAEPPRTTTYQGPPGAKPVRTDIIGRVERRDADLPGAAVVVVLLVIGLILFSGSGHTPSASAEWTGQGQVCDYDANCQDTFRCRNDGDTVQIYLPYGSFATGNEGWRWEADIGERCGDGQP